MADQDEGEGPPSTAADLFPMETTAILTQSENDLITTTERRERQLAAASTPVLGNDFVFEEDEEEEEEEEDELTIDHGVPRISSEDEINLEHYRRRSQYKLLRKDKHVTRIDFEGILKLIGGCSRWQMMCYIIVSIQQIPHAMFNLSVVYMMYQPDHWCQISNFTRAEIDVAGRDYTWQQILNSSVLFPEGTYKPGGNKWHSRCTYYDRDYDSLVGLSWKELQSLPDAEIKSCNKWEYDDSVMTHTIVTQFDKVCDDNWGRAHIHLTYSLGYLVGSVFSGMVSDAVGRKTALVLYGAISLAFAVILPYGDHYWHFLFLRFFLAVFNEAGDLAAYVFCMEITGTSYRSLVGSLMHAPWALGYAVLALCACLTKSWLSIHHFAYACHFVAVILMLFLPESPRWLIIKGRFKEAESVIRSACRYNKCSLPSDLGLAMCVEICHAEQLKYKREHDSSSVFLLFKSRELLKRNLVLYFLWASTALIYYGLVIALSDQSSPGRTIFSGNFFFNNALSGAIEFPTLFFCVVLLSFGRKNGQMFALMGAGIILLLALGAVQMQYATVSLILMLLGKSLIQCAFNILYIFTSELSPTVLRNTAIGIASTISRLGSATSGYVAILSDVTLPIVPMAIFALFSLVAGTFVVFLPETRDIPLPDTIWDAVKLSSPMHPCFSRQNKAELDERYADAPVVAANNKDDAEDDHGTTERNGVVKRGQHSTA